MIYKVQTRDYASFEIEADEARADKTSNSLLFIKSDKIVAQINFSEFSHFVIENMTVTNDSLQA